MARITKAEQSLVPSIGMMVAPALLARLSQDELSDRAHYAATLLCKAAAQTDPTIKTGYSRLAGAVLQAPIPRDEVETQAQDLLTKAQLTVAQPMAEQLRAQAQRLLEDNPVAPRRQQRVRAALRKAADEGQVAVYTADGTLVGVCDPAKITRVVSAKPAADGDDTQAAQTPQAGPAAAAAPAPVAKARADARRLVGVMTRPR